MLPTDLPQHRWAIDTHSPPYHTPQMEDDAQKPTSHVACLQQEPSPFASIWWSDGKEGEMKQLEAAFIMKTMGLEI